MAHTHSKAVVMLWQVEITSARKCETSGGLASRLASQAEALSVGFSWHNQ